MDAYGVVAVDASDLALTDASYAHLSSDAEEASAIELNAKLENLELKVSNETIVVGIRPLNDGLNNSFTGVGVDLGSKP